LNDALYLNLIGQDDLRQVIREGVPSTTMPAFGQKFGGQLTDAQIDLLADQIRSRWAKPGEIEGLKLPPYSQRVAAAKGAGPGEPQRGATAYVTYCSQCHGTDGRGGSRADESCPSKSFTSGLVCCHLLRIAPGCALARRAASSNDVRASFSSPMTNRPPNLDRRRLICHVHGLTASLNLATKVRGSKPSEQNPRKFDAR
jgi:mono/diheme cytochrome c family protein